MAIKNISINKQKIIIGSDHAGFKLKERLKKYFKKKYILYEDLGTSSEKPADYPDYAFRVAQKVSKNKNAKGILICGTGTGMVIAANKVKGIRAVAAYDTYSAKMSRLHNNTNILGLRGRLFPYKKIEHIIEVWLKTPFSKEKRHKKRISKIAKYEQ
ncbi:ribose 5-phosphate isomerase B [Candidatus Woesearchaeota archaeon]|nr:ribose 5-phosphate isomerase B [Candidatus Woesearchaeota archaeon]